MRYLGVVSALALGAAVLCALPAAAQQSGSPMGDMMDMARRMGSASQWSATRPTPLSQLSHKSREWMKAEAQRQASSPRPIMSVVMDINEILHHDMRQLAETVGVHPQDVSDAVLLQIMTDAEDILEHEQRETRSAPTPVVNGPSLDERIARAEADRKEALDLQTPASLAIVTM